MMADMSSLSPRSQGASLKATHARKLFRNIEEAIDLYVEDVKAAGEPIPVEDEQLIELL